MMLTLIAVAALSLPGDGLAGPVVDPERQAAPTSAAPTQPPAAVRTTVLGLPLNMGPGDRTLRGALALGLAAFGGFRLATGRGSRALNGALLGVSVLPASTALSGYCFLYQLVGLQYSF
jgi:hypothetical protein